MDPQIIDNAKAIVRNKYGAALAEKASDAFCLSLTPQFFANTGMLEAAPSASQQASMIIEFTPEPGEKKSKKASKDFVSRNTDAWKNFKKAVEELKLSSEEVKLQLEQMLRQARIKPSREKFLKSVGSITAHIESSLGRLYAMRTESLRNQTLTHVCWLNQSVRSLADPLVMAEVAADSKIKLIDLPRQ